MTSNVISYKKINDADAELHTSERTIVPRTVIFISIEPDWYLSYLVITNFWHMTMGGGIVSCHFHCRKGQFN